MLPRFQSFAKVIEKRRFQRDRTRLLWSQHSPNRVQAQRLQRHQPSHLIEQRSAAAAAQTAATSVQRTNPPPKPNLSDPCDCSGDLEPPCLPPDPCCAKINYYVTGTLVLRDKVKLSSRRVTTREEEKNIHTFENAGGDSHIVAKYFYVSKEVEGQVYSHGLRTTVELLIPSPAALYEHLQVQQILRSMPCIPDAVSIDDFDVKTYREFEKKYCFAEALTSPPIPKKPFDEIFKPWTTDNKDGLSGVQLLMTVYSSATFRNERLNTGWSCLSRTRISASLSTASSRAARRSVVPSAMVL